MSYDFDLFVIGGGSGGVRAARLAAQKGLRVAMAEGDRMGGTCVIRGCVPKKLMLFASDFSEILRISKGYGWTTSSAEFNWTEFHEKLTAELNRLEGVYTGIMDKNNVRLFHAYATLEDAHHITLDNGLRFSTERILIATGGRPYVPEFEGSELTITSDDVFNLEKLPQSILVYGGGYIACEFAGIFNQMGVEVTQVYRGDLVLRGYDAEARTILADEMTRRGIALHHNCNITKIEVNGSKKRVTLSNHIVHEVDEVLAATGRVANIEDIGLENAGVNVKDGYIEVDDFSQTSVENIYAIGDVTGRAALTPVAIREAVNFINTVYDEKPSKIDYSIIPTAIFTRPEFGTIGLSEDAAREAGYEIDVYATKFRPMMVAFSQDEDVMYMKIIVDKATDRVLGVHILGVGAGEMIQLVGIAVTMGATKAQFDATIAVHPTAAEELVTLKTPRES